MLMGCHMKGGFGGRELLGYLVKYCPMLRMRSFWGSRRASLAWARSKGRRIGDLKITPQPKPDSPASGVGRASSPCFSLFHSDPRRDCEEACPERSRMGGNLRPVIPSTAEESISTCHSRARLSLLRKQESIKPSQNDWIPASAGMTFWVCICRHVEFTIQSSIK
jgi:hypothetical protein